MKQFQFLLQSFIVAAVFVFPFGGCGDSENKVIQPGALTPEQQAEMDQLGEQLNESMSRSPGVSGGEPSKVGN